MGRGDFWEVDRDDNLLIKYVIKENKTGTIMINYNRKINNHKLRLSVIDNIYMGFTGLLRLNLPPLPKQSLQTFNVNRLIGFTQLTPHWIIIC